MSVLEFPHRNQFAVEGTYLNSGFIHPMSLDSQKAIGSYTQERMYANEVVQTMQTDRVSARSKFAQLINCEPDELAWIPSTMVGENLIASGLNLGQPGVHIVTDAAHFEPSIHLYEQLRQKGTKVTVIPMNDRGVIDLADLASVLCTGVKLVAVSLVSATNGFQHDLKAVCDLAHANGALVYADLIQAAGSIPIDVRESQVDFCACSTYKWLMGDFGVGFLYVRRDSLHHLHASQTGYRQLTSYSSHFFPYDLPFSRCFSFKRFEGTAGTFEVGTLGNAAVAALNVSLDYLLKTGVERIAAYRQPMIDRLQEELPEMGFGSLTPRNCSSPIVTFARRDAERLRPAFTRARIQVQIYPNRIRISPSVFNDMTDLDFFLTTLRAAALKD